MKLVRLLCDPIIFGFVNVRYHFEQTAVLSLGISLLFFVSFFFPFLFVVSAPLYLIWAIALTLFGGVQKTSVRKAIAYTKNFQPIALQKPITGLKLFVFQTGKIESGSWGVYEGPSRPIVLDQPAFLIKHPKKGLIMFETGINPKVATDPVGYVGKFLYFCGFLKMQQNKAQDIYSQLIANDFEVNAIKTIYVSHLHPEHGGAVSLFQNSEIAVDKKEYDYAMGKPKYNYFKKEYETVKKWNLLNFDKTKPFAPFDGALDIFSDGSVFVVSTPGHTPGSISVLLNLPSGTVFLVGDIAWRAENITTATIGMPFVSVDSVDHRKALGKLIAFTNKNPEVLIVPTHDIRSLKTANRGDIQVFK